MKTVSLSCSHFVTCSSLPILSFFMLLSFPGQLAATIFLACLFSQLGFTPKPTHFYCSQSFTSAVFSCSCLGARKHVSISWLRERITLFQHSSSKVILLSKLSCLSATRKYKNFPLCLLSEISKIKWNPVNQPEVLTDNVPGASRKESREESLPLGHCYFFHGCSLPDQGSTDRKRKAGCTARMQIACTRGWMTC